jgi:hypothetical protein
MLSMAAHELNKTDTVNKRKAGIKLVFFISVVV